MEIHLIAAVADNGVIGVNGDLPWKIPNDLRRFKALTLGKPVVMGRKTFESIGGALNSRLNIVLTRDATWQPEDETDRLRVIRVRSLEESGEKALQKGFGKKLWVIGGAEIYAMALPHSYTLELTEVHATPAGDTFFPEWNRADFTEIEREKHAATETAPAYDFVTYVRKKPAKGI
jgi:dihydrofolate reductase